MTISVPNQARFPGSSLTPMGATAMVWPCGSFTSQLRRRGNVAKPILNPTATQVPQPKYHLNALSTSALCFQEVTSSGHTNATLDEAIQLEAPA